jgi:hypothetical protein
MRPYKTPKMLWLLVLPLGGAWTARAATPPVDGEILFTELMIDPMLAVGSETNEWIEIYSRAAEDRLLEGCYLIEGTASTCAALGGIPGHCFRLVGNGSPLTIASEDYALFALRGDIMSGQCGITPDLDYSTLSLNNNVAETMQLYCQIDGTYTSVATITYNSSGGTKGASWMLDQAYVQSGDIAEARDFSNWFPAPADSGYCPPDTRNSEFGTPGAANETAPATPTPVPKNPFPKTGEVVLSELATWGGASDSSPDWIELYVPPKGGALYELNGCRLRGLKCADGGFADDAACRAADLDAYEKTKSSSLKTLQPSVPLTGGGYALLGASSTKTCIAFDPADSSVCQVAVDATWSSVTLYSDDTAVVELDCPDDGDPSSWVVVDKVLFNGSDVTSSCSHADGLCSWELRDDALDAAANDASSAWRFAGSKAPYTAYRSSSYTTAYGTPRMPNLFGPRVPVPAGGLVITEFPIWPYSGTESPDWIELLVADEPPTGERYNLTECTLRSYDCDPGSTYATCLQDGLASLLYSTSIKATSDASPQAGAGELVLLGSSATHLCVEVDAAGTCLTEVRGSYGSTLGPSSSSTGLPRMLELACPDADGDSAVVDRVVFSGDWISPTCGQGLGHCSWELRPGAIDAEQNDDPRNWTSAVSDYLEPGGDTVKGTPARENGVEERREAGGAPEPGDVAFSEIMLAPKAGPEWFELQGVNASGDGLPFDLAGCMLIQVKDADVATCDPNLPLDEKLCAGFSIPDAVSVPIAAEQRRLLLKGEACLSYGEGSATGEPGATCLIPADLQYEKLDFSSSSAQVAALWCPGTDSAWQLIDALAYDWAAVKAQCPTSSIASCSVSIHPKHVNAEENDREFYRCVSPYGAAPDGSPWPTWIDLGGKENTGTPGEENRCPELARVPIPGSLVITELMIGASGSDDDLDIAVNEWFELYNTTSEPLDFKTCSLEVVPVNADGSLNQGKASSYPQSANPVTGASPRWTVLACIRTSAPRAKMPIHPTWGIPA